MNLFDELVTIAIKNQPDLSPLRIVVEKELLHHDILRILSEDRLLKDLTFIGGTCLRACYGSMRLSEHLDFTGGNDFSRKSLSQMGEVLTSNLNEKYGLRVAVSEPKKDINNVDTWKIQVETKPKQKQLSAQRINIDICQVPSYEKRPMLLLNPYGIDMGTGGLIIQAQSREEIYADKLLAFALRPNRLKNRDLWDIVWLHQQGLTLRLALIPKKLQDRNLTTMDFFDLYHKREKLLSSDSTLKIDFKKEMQRFLPTEQINKVIDQDNLWDFIIYLMGDLGSKMRENIRC